MQEDLFDETTWTPPDLLPDLSKEKLILAPDCGLGHLSRELAIQKLKIMSSVARKFN